MPVEGSAHNRQKKEELLLRLHEAEAVLDAIRNGEVDAVVVRTPVGEKVFTLEGSYHPSCVLVETMNEGACTLAFDGTILFCNSRLCTMLDRPLPEILGEPFLRFVVPSDADAFDAILHKGRQERCSVEIRITTPEEKWIPVIFSCRPLDQDGKEGICAVITDLSEKIRLDETIASGNLAKSIIEQAGEVIVVCNEEGRVIRASQLTNDLLGKSPMGEHFDDVYRLTMGETERLFTVADPLQRRFRRNEEVRLKVAAETILYFLLNAAPLTDDGDRVIGCVVTLTDITYRKEAEKNLQRAREELEQRVAERTLDLARTVRELREKEHMLLQQSRLAAMGEMISNIAHQWRQPLNALGLIIQELPMVLEEGELTPEFLDQSVANAMMLVQHMSSTIDDFRNFFKPDKEKVPFRLSQVVGNAVKLIEASFDNREIEITLHFQDDPTIVGYPNEYSQVILNILNNAKDAVEARGTEKPMVEIRIAALGEKSLLTITDNAGGIPEEIIYKVFDPHFTTKDTQGTGIGLFMAKNIIEKGMNGRVSVRNTGTGAEFTIEV
ncbi:PAS domain-containing sensor histidine kinase [Geomesophilobacter sediminis]|uniref:histidine kinase n=1 Tax=Geomesophilobacter sediminis TaxID=2798584 RepID=A0A8J7M066_9BACT|nr:PAS domain-containing sensor histidine kinase [Geomesophilobacter sediminis]MBJ6723582.1 PAS domain-containing protein [Geomesophilobacter sediminis]